MQQEIAEIDRIQGPEPFLIGPVQIEGPARGEVGYIAGRHLFRPEPAILPTLDIAKEDASRPALFIDVRGGHNLFQQANLIVGIENGEVGFETGQFGLTPEDAGADRVEGADPKPFGGLSDQLFDTSAHLPRGPVGESDGEHLAGPRPAGKEDMGEPGGQDAGLAGPGPSQHQHRAFDRLDGITLRRVQRFEIGRRRTRSFYRVHAPRIFLIRLAGL